MSEPDWDVDTRTIREWVRGGCVSTDRIVAELVLWAEYLSAPIGDRWDTTTAEAVAS